MHAKLQHVAVGHLPPVDDVAAAARGAQQQRPGADHLRVVQHLRTATDSFALTAGACCADMYKC